MDEKQDGYSEQEYLRAFIAFINQLEDIKSGFRNLSLPDYLTDEQRTEWRAIASRYERDLTGTIDKAAIELDKEEWYE